MASYLGNNPDNIIKTRKGNYRYVATVGQTAFSGSDSNSLTMTINTSDVEVFLNGVLLDQTDYTVTGTTVTLTTGATVGDIVEVITNTEFQVSSLYTKEEVDLKVSTAITNLKGGVGTALDTLSELATALNNDASYATTITNALGTKADASTVNSALALKVSIDSTTGAASIPVGTTAQRPVSPSVGMTRYNTTINAAEVYNGSAWIVVGDQTNMYSVDYLVIAGGGSGSAAGGVGGGGGGAGGYLAASTGLTIGQTYTITIGGGGPGGNNTNANGNPSAISTVATAVGGGSGSGDSTLPGPNNGGSGGGGGSSNTPGPGSGTAGQGYAGGNSPDVWQGGGGGGAGGVGGSSAGADGLNWLSLGVTRAGGGGAGRNTWQGGGSAGVGGAGGGGAGGYRTGVSSEVNGGDGTANTGSGGGGGGRGIGGSGGSGIVIIRYQGTQRGTGGTVTSAGGYTYHTFTTSGSYTA